MTQKNLTPQPKQVGVYWLKSPSNSTIIDQCCVTYFQSPESFTGEDMLEINCHGNPKVIQNILTALYDLGVEAAEQGAFTKRAFINGKLTLAQVEAVSDILNHSSDIKLQASLHQLKGSPLKHIEALKKSCLQLLEHLEGSIDFPDEIPAISHSYLIDTLESIRVNLDKFLNQGKLIQAASHKISCCFIGPTNVGKSSLFNALLGFQRAIVSNKAGTTRDYISAILDFKGLLIEFIDTAGLRSATEDIEQEGIEHMLELSKTCDVTCLVLDKSATKPIDSKFQDLINSQKISFVVLNKSDLVSYESPNLPKGSYKTISISAKTGEGVTEFLTYLSEHIVGKEQEIEPDFVCNARQLSLLAAILEHLKQLKKDVSLQVPDDILAYNLKEMLKKLSQLNHQTITEEVLDGIFSHFCIGK